MKVKVRVENFQSIGDAEVEIDGFTVVTGQNNTGKTSLQRAIRGVFQNTPGTAFIREGETQSRVTVDFGDDGKVSWTKGTGARDRPSYSINDGEPIHPGSSVPDEVAAFGVVPIQAGGQEIWPTIAPQFSGQVFLLDRPGSAVAEAVADVERVGQLNRALRNSESDKRQTAATLRVRKQDLILAEQDASRYEGLEDALEALEALEVRQEALQRQSLDLDHLKALQSSLGQAQALSLRLSPVSSVDVPQGGDFHRILEGVRRLYIFKRSWDQARQDVARYQRAHQLDIQLDAGKAPKILDALDLLRGFRDRLSQVSQEEARLQDEIRQAEIVLREAQHAVEEAMIAVQKCPLCGAVTDGV